jgi:hypothetical protein
MKQSHKVSRGKGVRRGAALLAVLLATLLAVAVPVAAGSRPTFPQVIPLPNGHRPEGIAVGRGSSFYAGSLGDGSVYGGDLRTGAGDLVVPPQEGRVAVGLAVDVRSNTLFAAGGPMGEGYVYDIASGESLAVFAFTTESPTFVNDVVVTRDAAYFTDSFRPYFYKVPLGPGGKLPDAATFEEIALGGDFVQGMGFNINGIDATADGKTLVMVKSGTGELFRVDPTTGEATLIDLGGDAVPNGDGILLDGGKTLYVVQNQLNQIAVVELDPTLSSGSVVRTITDDDFDVPTTMAEFGDALYAVNARFSTPPTPDTEYDVVRVSKH